MLTTAFGAAYFYAAVFLIGAVILQWRVILLRRSRRIGIGDGGDKDLARACRIHGNYVENVPFALAAMVLLAAGGGAAWPVHLVGATMLAGRVLHAIGLSTSAGASPGRVAGMLLTQFSLVIAAIILLMRVI